MSNLQIENLNVGDRFWYKGREFELQGRNTEISDILIPEYLAKETDQSVDETWKLWREFGYDKDLMENVIVSISECEPVFTGKEESIRYYLPYLKQHINNLAKELEDKKEHLYKATTRYNFLQIQILQMTDYE